MTLPRAHDDREYQNFVDRNDIPTRAVFLNLLAGERIPVDSEDGVTWDLIEATYPTPIQEVYTYKLLTNVVQTITVNYTASNKKFISSVTKV